MTTHDDFRALCAISTAENLTEKERRRLEEHLLACPECRKAAQEYETVARIVMPTLVQDFPADVSEPPKGWSEQRAKQELFRQLGVGKPPKSVRLGRFGSGRQEFVQPAIASEWGESSPWLHRTIPTLPYACAIALAVLIGLLGYQVGEKRGVTPVPVSKSLVQEVNEPRDEIAALSQERQLLRAQLAERDHAMANLSDKATRQLTEIQDLRNADHEAQDSYQRAQEEKAQIASERDALRHKLEQSQSDLASMQTDMESLRQLRANDAFRLAELDARVGKLPELVKDRDATIEQLHELLARDRDIRDLMGARDLLFQEVSDVGRDGKTKQPFGRVFYTKDKSLIFYAYDLDRQPGLHDASTFQVWGRRGPDIAQAMSLGIFYVDDTSHKRWVMKSNDVKSLHQIDAVFVTAEPNGGSRKPSGKEFLFTYLRVEPNHP